MDKNIEITIASIKKDIILNKNVQLYKKDIIGEGTIAKVYKLNILGENKNLALKIISKEFYKNNIPAYINFLKNIKKPFFSKMYDNFEDDHNYYIIMEYYKYNLNFFLKGGIQIKHVFTIIEKINDILLKLNSINLIFRNIKPENIFIVNNSGSLDDDFDIILSDCCYVYLTLFREYPAAFAFKNFFPPEIKTRGDLDIKSDLWSLGKLIYYMVFSIYIENPIYTFEPKFLHCIKYAEFRNILMGLLEEEVLKRINWNEYITKFKLIKDEIYKKDYDDIIDLAKVLSIRPTSIIFQPTDNFDNIIILLAELSKSEYIDNNCLYTQDFDARGNKLPYDYSRNQKRGNILYVPPLGWTGIGLNISKYQNWEIKCGNCNIEGEWCVAYHGTSFSNAKNIIIEGLKEGPRQAFQNAIDDKGKIVGKGVYFSPIIEIAEQYSISCEGIKCVFMCRVNPSKVKRIDRESIFVVNNPEVDAIPYRLLIKDIAH